MTLEDWLAGHSYLRPLAGVVDSIDDALSEIGTPETGSPGWEAYLSDFQAGIPLLRSARAGVDFEPAGMITLALVEKLSSHGFPEKMGGSLSGLWEELRREPDVPWRVAAWLLAGDGLSPSDPGLLRFLGWSAGARYLRPLLLAYERWREPLRWLRGECPTCGSLPAMAQLVGADQGRRRLLVCGRCRTRWEFPRTGCPFCGQDSQTLAIIAVEGEAGLRIDHCGSCRGYLKTYAGEGAESVLLSDWTSLHLDVLARDRGLERWAGSLYDLAPAAA